MKRINLLFMAMLTPLILNAQYDINGDYKISGNLGIGTTDISSAKLNLQGNNSWQLRLKDIGTGGSTWRIGSTGNNWSVGGGKFVICNTENSSGASFTIAPNGFIGIGTNYPTNAKLQIQGADDYGAVLRLKNTGTDGGDWSLVSTNTNWAAGSQDLLFTFGIPQSTNTKVIFTNDGKVGIGTYELPGNYKLYVAGNILTEGVKVKLKSQWSDFVFKNDYNLRTLEEIENYIIENERLPDIPSESEVVENGINLGEMDAKLLQKIEELTLYMIEINKEVKTLKQENSDLKEEIKEIKSVK